MWKATAGRKIEEDIAPDDDWETEPDYLSAEINYLATFILSHQLHVYLKTTLFNLITRFQILL